MSNATDTTATFHIIRSRFGFFVGTFGGRPGWGTHEEDAYRMPSRAAADRWVERIREHAMYRTVLLTVTEAGA